MSAPRDAIAALLALVLAAVPAAAAAPSAEQVRAAQGDAAYRQHATRFGELYDAGRYGEALPEAVAALERAPVLEEPYVWVSKLSTLLGRDREAIDLFRRTGVANPGLAWPWYYKGFNEYHQSLFDDALESFRKAAAADPGHAPSWYRQGMILYNKGEFADSRRALERAFALAPDDPTTAAQLVDVQRITGDYDAATATVSQALRRLPDAAGLHHARGLLLARERKLDEAEAAFRRAIELDPALRAAHQELGRVLIRSGRRDEGRRELAVASRLGENEHAREVLSNNVNAATSPGVPLLLAEVELTGGRYEEAMRWFTRTQQMGLTSPRVAAGIAEAAFHLGNKPLGDRVLEQLAGVDDGRVDLARAAEALLTGDLDAAAAHAGRAAERGPVEREFLRRCAGVLERAGRVEAAAALHERADEAPEVEFGRED